MSKTRQFSHPLVLGFSIVGFGCFERELDNWTSLGGCFGVQGPATPSSRLLRRWTKQKLSTKKTTKHTPQKKQKVKPTLFPLFFLYLTCSPPNQTSFPVPPPHSFSFSLLLLSFYTPPSTHPQSSYSTFHRTHIYISDPQISFPLLLFPKPSLALFLSVS